VGGIGSGKPIFILQGLCVELSGNHTISNVAILGSTPGVFTITGTIDNLWV
jgi:hypothetical protein